MHNAINMAAAVGLLWLMLRIHVLRNWTAGTTADVCRRWALVATASCLVAAIVRFVDVPLQRQSAGQYLAAVLLLSPVIGILGARQPGFRAWPWFVVLPMIVVLQWPSLSEILAGPADSALEIPTPTFGGFVLVLVMGFGNYFGTINTLAAMCSGLGVLLIALPVTEFVAMTNAWCFPVGSLLLAFSVTLLPGRYWEVTASTATEHRDVTALWIDFRDLYGIVWAKRVMDRVNQFASREAWNVRLTLDGFVSASEPSELSLSSDKIGPRQIEVLCWVLKRFVDPEFVKRYL